MTNIKIGSKELTIPIIQGGMGVGVSLGNLSGHVAKNGGMGVISTAHPGYREENFLKDTTHSNLIALDKEIKKAKAIANGKGMVAVNVMVAITDYDEMVKQSVESGVDAIISGAGLPLTLPKHTKGTDIALAPIVSSGRVATLICRTWDKKFNVIPDFIVIEGSEAGGHLGFDKNDLIEGKTQSLEEILSDVLSAIAPYEEKYNKKIPVFVAGGVYDGKDIRHFLDLKASGVQMATRFIATTECDASDTYKQMFVDCKKKDIVIVKSPVGMPGRAMRTKLIDRLADGETIPLTHCFNCLKPCDPKTTPYCISMALINAVKGDVDQGLVFCGSNAYRIEAIQSVDTLISELLKECEE